MPAVARAAQRRRGAALLLASLVAAALGAPAEDAIESLPGYGPPPSRQWSGYLNGSAEEPGTMLHYWLAEAEHESPSTQPVVLWLNGGPGSSSIIGMLQEHGPLLINATGGLMKNPYGWTKQANLLILESPGGVGYSYCAAMKTGGSCKYTDITTAKVARAALQDFFNSKFPELRNNGFYITGESYAGVYIPTLSAQLLMHAPEVHLKGIAVGDPCTDTPSQKKSMNMLWYAHKHGFVPDGDYKFLTQNCSYEPEPAFLARGHWVREAGRWAAAVAKEQVELGMSGDVRLKDACKVAYRRYIATTSRGISQGWKGAYINELDLFADAAALAWDVPGSLDGYTAEWMNRADVRQALHVEASAPSWPGPQEGWEYSSSYNACNEAPEGTPSMIDFYREIAPKLARTIVFNGDSDPCVSYEGTRTAIEKVGFPTLTGGEYRPWFYDHGPAALETLKEKPNLFGLDLELQDAGPQFGGHVVDYANNLSFVTVHGAGHMVPQFRPQAGARLLNRLLTGEAFSPPLPSGDELLEKNETEFDVFVDAWTTSARGMARPSSPSFVV